MMKKLFVILALVLCLSGLILSGCTQPSTAPTTPATTPTPEPEAKVLKIGVVYGLTGPGSETDLMHAKVAQLCADWVNEKGGITVKGEKYKIELVVEDEKRSPSGGVDAATKLVYQEKVKFITGGDIPVINEAIGTVTNKNQVLYTTCKTAVVTPEQPYTFASNGGFASPVPGIYQALLKKYPTVKTIGFIAEDEPGARAVTELSLDVAKKMGFTTLEPLDHPWEGKEFYPQWTKMLMSKPDAVDNGVKLPGNTANCIKQGRELGFTGPMFAAMPGDPALLISLIGNKEYATDFIWSSISLYAPEATPMMKDIAKRWEAEYNTPCDTDATMSWDSLWFIIQAIEKAQSLDPTEVKNTLQNTTTIETASGTAKMGGAQVFGINNMAFNPCPISRLVKGEAEFIMWFDPWLP